MASEYRARVYGAYVNGPQPVPQTLRGLAPRGPYLNRLIRQHFPQDQEASILDLGCGHGALIHYARLAGYANILGVDGSPEQVAAARRLGIEGVNEGDVVTTLANCRTASLGCIVAFDVIEHFTRDELLSLADDVKRVLEPGGVFLIHTPNGESPFASRIRYGDLTHELAFTRASLAQLLHASGFSEVRSYEDAPVVHSLKSAVRWVIWRIIRAMLRLYLAAETGETGRDAIFSQSFLTVTRA